MKIHQPEYALAICTQKRVAVTPTENKLCQNNGGFIKKIFCFEVALKAFDSHVTLHLQSWQHLAHWCQMNNVYLFRLRPKCHYLQHLGRDTKRNRLNPRLVSACFSEESFLGYVKRIAVKCHSSSMIRERFWQRYLMFMAVRFQNNRATSRCKPEEL